MGQFRVKTEVLAHVQVGAKERTEQILLLRMAARNQAGVGHGIAAHAQFVVERQIHIAGLAQRNELERIKRALPLGGVFQIRPVFGPAHLPHVAALLGTPALRFQRITGGGGRCRRLGRFGLRLFDRGCGCLRLLRNAHARKRQPDRKAQALGGAKGSVSHGRPCRTRKSHLVTPSKSENHLSEVYRHRGHRL